MLSCHIPQPPRVDRDIIIGLQHEARAVTPLRPPPQGPLPPLQHGRRLQREVLVRVHELEHHHVVVQLGLVVDVCLEQGWVESGDVEGDSSGHFFSTAAASLNFKERMLSVRFIYDVIVIITSG